MRQFCLASSINVTMFFIVFLSVITCVDWARSQDANTVNETLLPTGRMIQPAGESIAFHGRPVDLELSPDQKYLFVKDWKSLRIVDLCTFKTIQNIPATNGASMYGLAVDGNGNVYYSNSKRNIHVFSPRGDKKEDAGDDVEKEKDKTSATVDGPYVLSRSIELPKDSYPCGIALSADETKVYVCLSKLNAIATVDLKTGNVKSQTSVGVAPFDVILQTNNDSGMKSHEQLYVSNIGGRLPIEGDKTAPSAKTETVVDKRGIASTGSVSVVNLETNKIESSIDVGRHPSVLQKSTFVGAYVCNTNDDTVQWVAAKAEPRTWTVKPDARLPFGSMPSAMASSADSKTMFVALAGNNAIAVVNLSDNKGSILGLIPTGWYPASLAVTDNYLYVGNVKGQGARSEVREMEKGRNSHDHRGTVQRIALADIQDEAKLAEWTKQVKKNSRVPQILRSSLVSNETKTAVPCPEKLGEPSLFKHVIYVVKENRTFDQVFGDFKQARSEPKLCIFPREITPNHHALAERFGILDNYYCNGVLSADGHSWATEGNVTPYLERSFGGFARSYTFGDDPITYSSSGFIWDHFLDAGLSFRNYGEFDYARPPKGTKYQDVWNAYEKKEPLEISQNIGIERLRKYSCREYPGWNMIIPDQLRVDKFLKEFREFEKNDGLPSLSLVYLPQDHLGGGITTRSHMADNDLALGRLVEAISNSKYWNDTVIIVNEDDPQNGFDHIDGHRSICLVISAYSKGGVNHSFYNQSSALRTMLHFFGLPPMNQQDGSAPLMADCFRSGEPDLKPYKAIPANFPLNEAPAPKKKQTSTEQKWRAILATVPIERTGMKSEKDEDNLNRFIWHEMKGWETPYPTEWSGAHARGLEKLGLSLNPDSDEAPTP